MVADLVHLEEGHVHEAELVGPHPLLVSHICRVFHNPQQIIEYDTNKATYRLTLQVKGAFVSADAHKYWQVRMDDQLLFDGQVKRLEPCQHVLDWKDRAFFMPLLQRLLACVC